MITFVAGVKFKMLLISAITFGVAVAVAARIGIFGKVVRHQLRRIRVA
tara:strand:+ start:88 stop:231 length:144 start_codon:yes stop_codon:yes gene_type:complete